MSISEQVALSFDAPATPGFSIHGATGSPADSARTFWGLGWYSDNQRAASLLSDRDLPPGAALSGHLERLASARSSLFLGRSCGPDPEESERDPQPFVKPYAGRSWSFSSVGELSPELKTGLSLDDSFDMAPIGASPAEHAFSWLIARIRSRGSRTIEEYGWVDLRDLFLRVNEFGAACFMLSDGIDLVIYRDREETVPLYWTRLTPPHEEPRLAGRIFGVDFDGPMDASRTLLVASTLPMKGASWTPLEISELRVIRRGATVWSSHPSGLDEHVFAFVGTPQVDGPASAGIRAAAEQQQHSNAPMLRFETGPERVTLTVLHETHYKYQEPIERSSHRFCLVPVHDGRQELIEHSFEISVDGVRRDYEDVFGNHATILEVSSPYSEMLISSRSKVSVEPVVGSQLKSPLRRDQIPLVWMPWQRQMMQAYLMPPELPEPELRELSEFAMSFVERNDYDLVETLLDMNRTIYRDFTYVPGSTTVETTPFEVYVQRRGVCQDFANVLICIARLLGVPARYRVGYIYAGGSYQNKIQSDASHAWAEVYLPWTGWFGFDPTNGCLAGSDHIRVACGRQFRDAAPTTGTIYRGGGFEILEINVRVERLGDA